MQGVRMDCYMGNKTFFPYIHLQTPPEMGNGYFTEQCFGKLKLFEKNTNSN